MLFRRSRLGEEFIFRGIVANALNKYGAFSSVLVIATVFAVAHGFSVLLLLTFLVGVMAGILFRQTQSIWPGLDAIGTRLLNEHGARSAPKLVYDFPGSTCISINEEAAHGIPGDRVIKSGDVLNVDVSAELNGYYGDTGGTKVIGISNALKTRLCHATRKALNEAMKSARAGQPINVIGAAIERTAKSYGFKIIRNLGSHGVGRALHEEPEYIPGYFDPSDKRVLKEGMVITIEPFLSTKSSFVKETSDGWTLTGAPGNLSAQYEHTMIITKGNPIVLTEH